MDDVLYPEWDEFYLLVCDICGIVIKPQALKKHLATKHRISAQNGHTQSPPVDSKPSTTQTTQNGHTQSPLVDSDTSTTQTTQNGTSSVAATLSMAQPQNVPSAPPLNTQTKFWGGKHALDSIPKPAIKRSYSLSLSSSSNTSSSAPSLSRYQDRKWRTTFNVLKNAFL